MLPPEQWTEPWFLVDQDHSVYSQWPWRWKAWQEYVRMERRLVSHKPWRNISFLSRRMDSNSHLKRIALKVVMYNKNAQSKMQACSEKRMTLYMVMQCLTPVKEQIVLVQYDKQNTKSMDGNIRQDS